MFEEKTMESWKVIERQFDKIIALDESFNAFSAMIAEIRQYRYKSRQSIEKLIVIAHTRLHSWSGGYILKI